MALFTRHTVVLFSLMLAFFLVGCSSTDDDKMTITDPKVLFDQGLGELVKDNYQEAVVKFELVEREHPASYLASEAQVRKAYSYYLDEKFDLAIMVIDDFVKQYPAHTSVSYMYYLRGLCYFDQIVDVGRDQQLTNKAVVALNEVITRFPNSKYARDAKLKVEYALNNLAGKEMEIGRFYLNNNDLVAALNRFKAVIEGYQTSIFVTEALYRVAEIYYTLGDIEQAKHYAAVLGYNYPNSEWYEKAYGLIVEKKYGKELPWYEKVKKVW
jgi:outer membrane protein assembly factor BamD